MLFLRTGLAVLALLACAGLQAKEYYRYVDSNGVTVISRQGVPSDVIANGYEVLNDQGRVVRVVPRALTPEEHRVLKQERERQIQQDAIDRQLLQLYSQESDVDRAEKRKHAEIDVLIGLVHRNLKDVQEEKAAVLKEAGNHERAGRTVPAKLVDKITALETRERDYLQDVERYQELKKTASADFAAEKQRLIQLLKAK